MSGACSAVNLDNSCFKTATTNLLLYQTILIMFIHNNSSHNNTRHIHRSILIQSYSSYLSKPFPYPVVHPKTAGSSRYSSSKTNTLCYYIGIDPYSFRKKLTISYFSYICISLHRYTWIFNQHFFLLIAVFFGIYARSDFLCSLKERMRICVLTDGYLRFFPGYLRAYNFGFKMHEVQKNKSCSITLIWRKTTQKTEISLA